MPAWRSGLWYLTVSGLVAVSPSTLSVPLGSYSESVMSLAETVMAAMPTMVVSPGATVTGCSGPQSVSVMLPEKVPESRRCRSDRHEEGGQQPGEGEKSQTHDAP